MLFKNRQEAGEQLAKEVVKLKPANPSVLALPRGGVPVAAPVAQVLGAPLDVLVVRKVGSAGNPEYGLGAISEGNVVVARDEEVTTLGGTKETWQSLIKKERRELERRVKLYRQGKKLPGLEGKTAVLVDDGLATGATALAAVKAAGKLNPDKIVFAVPVGSPTAVSQLEKEGVLVICLDQPEDLAAIGNYYQDFSQVTDQEVLRLLTAQ